MRWKELLEGAVDSKRSLLCVGLDTDMKRFGDEVPEGPSPQFAINKEIIENTHLHAAAYKLNMAFYEVRGVEGMRALEETVRYLRAEHPDILVILDAKKGDIGNTSGAYADAAFGHLGVDSVTVNAYMGRDAVDPFTEDPDRLCFVLCRTSNGSAREVQDFGTDTKLFMRMAELVKKWNKRGNLGLVVGATYPSELEIVRRIVGWEMPILVPGVGAQGGDLEAVLRKGTDARGRNILINVSRGIMFAYRNEEMAGLSMGEAASRAASRYRESIMTVLEDAGRW